MDGMGSTQLYYISQTAPTPIGQELHWSGAKNDENNDDQSQDDEDDCMLRDVDSSAFIFTRRGQFQDFRQAVVRLGPSGIQFTIPCKRNYGSARIFAKFHKLVPPHLAPRRADYERVFTGVNLKPDIISGTLFNSSGTLF